ncbi:McKusick-Kaufman/Bardet-Biedl syndromes putative chaperonin isoform 2 [Daubentonia madagascariensis]|uniref:McKusick-Kaufman/Bardet-Biedl syndromes putative chaperonin isoform 2 n=1 Tax=Daubentonia madagascariensis TaxID=31869 RepID=A0ABD2DAM1_DAUMA
MSFRNFWRDHKVLLVMVPLVGLIHLGWHRIKSSSVFQIPNKDDIPEQDSLALASLPKNQIQGK